MKHLKKLAGVVLALVMVMALAAPAFADPAPAATAAATPTATPDVAGTAGDIDHTNGQGTSSSTQTNDGIIKITSAVPGETYSIYRIFDLVSYSRPDGGDATYSYQVNSAWTNFVTGSGAGAAYVEINGNGYVEWKSGVDASDDGDPVKAFAKAALAYAKANNIAAVNSQPASTAGDVYFTGLPLGYYLVDSTVGAVLSLSTTDKSVTMVDKNVQPTVDKEVQTGTDANNNPTWGDKNTASIGDVVNYKTTIHAKKGATGYVLHDLMEAGLTFDETSLKVTVGGNELLKTTDYQVTQDAHDGHANGEPNCTFELTFDADKLAELTETGDVDIVITYSATLNKDAEIFGETNDNKTYLKYGNSSRTTEDKTETTTYQFDLVKTDGDNKLLDGAEFELYTADQVDVTTNADGTTTAALKTNAAAMEVYYDSAANTYRPADAAGETNQTTISVNNGKILFKGLGTGTYYLKETKAPTGYNLLAELKAVDITNGNLTATVARDTYESGGVQVINRSGSLLPETGGIGTTIFYIVGGALVVGAVVLLITKRRTSVDDE